MNLKLIYNRDGGLAGDGWVHIVPKGILPNKEHGIDQVLDDQALDAILESFQEEKRRYGNRWPGLYFGEEHFIYDPERSSEAFGWAKDFQKRADGIWARPEWTDLGEAAIKNKRFKYTSFVADPRDVEALDQKRARILRVETVGLTNYANGKHLLTPITNREFRRTAGAAPADGNQNKNQRTQMKSVATKLGLSAEASEETILAEVTKIVNRAETAESELTPLKNRVAEMTTTITSLQTEQVDGLLAEHGVKDEKIVNRLKPLLTPLKNREERVACLVDLGFKAGAARSERSEGRVLNRADAKQPGSQNGGQTEQERAEKIRNRAGELKKNGLNFDAAFAQATREAAAVN